jgi:multicomponent Na+:H+ antiporter subunit B
MAGRIFAVLAVVGLALMFRPFVFEATPFAELSEVATAYAERTDEDVGAANLVTAVIVTYRGLDTLGEVTVLFIATTGVGFLLARLRREPDAPAAPGDGDGVEAAAARPIEEPSEILDTGGRILIPIIVTFGVFIFSHGHLTPGGGFQGGVILASALLLFFLSRSPAHARHGLLSVVESVSGGFYVIIGILGLVLGAGFLDNRILPLGEFGTLFSAGAIPIIYSLVGLKVGAELSGILDNLRSDAGGHP